jgi:hypothetical protein
VFYPQRLELTSLTSGGRSVGIVRLRIKATEFSLVHVTLFKRFVMIELRMLEEIKPCIDGEDC